MNAYGMALWVTMQQQMKKNNSQMATKKLPNKESLIEKKTEGWDYGKTRKFWMSIARQLVRWQLWLADDNDDN